jgi:hypothetical protein
MIMTVSEAIENVNKIKPNRFSEEEKIKWLSEIDGLIVRELVDTHEDPPIKGDFSGYSESSMDVELLAPYPYDVLYRFYLESQIDLGNMEINKYNNSRTLFNNAYLTYTDWYNRTHMPKQKVKGFIFTERSGGGNNALSS